MNKEQKDIYILGIESSCDETAAAVVKNGREVLSNIISSQIVIHRKFGGVVPEIASRKHIENVMPVIDEALTQARPWSCRCVARRPFRCQIPGVGDRQAVNRRQPSGRPCLCQLFG